MNPCKHGLAMALGLVIASGSALGQPVVAEKTRRQRRAGHRIRPFARSPAVRERLASAGLEPQALCGEPFVAQIERELQANARLARELNLKAE